MTMVFIFFVLHIVFAFNTGYIDRDNEIILDRGKLVKNYMEFFFWFDLLVSFPFNWLEGFPLIGDWIKDHAALLMLMRLLRVINMIEISNALEYIASEVFKSRGMTFFIRFFNVLMIIICFAHVGI